MTGKDKGKQGEVIEVQRKNNRVVVAGLNLVRRRKAKDGTGTAEKARVLTPAPMEPGRLGTVRGVRELY